MRRPPLPALLALLLACCAGNDRPDPAPIEEWTIVLAADAIPAEESAARELREHLLRASGIELPLVVEGGGSTDGPTIEVGPTGAVRERWSKRPELGPEEWVVAARGRGLQVYGGRPRGTLYAVYHYLEDVVGVRWWTPFESDVPAHDRLPVPDGELHGRPAFVYRDVHGIDGPRLFHVRQRLNGQFSFLPWEYGGFLGYGPPKQAHTFYDYFPPEQYFGEHPQFYSEIDGLRFAGNGQLCLTDPDLLERAARKLDGFIDRAQAATPAGESPPRLFDFSQNDWGRYCRCAPCTALAEREGGQSGPLLAFVNALARHVAGRHPEVLVDTLAYHYSVEPPLHLRPEKNVVVRLAGLYGRDFSKPARDKANAAYLAAIDGWAAISPHLRIWDYSVVFGDEGEFPLPNLRVLAEDFRTYRERGVEGVFIQHDFPIAADLRDLKLWVIVKLLEKPEADLETLVRGFTDGYYGQAGAPIRAYIEALEQAAREKPASIRYRAGAADYGYLDPAFLVRAHGLFDDAERSVAGDPLRTRRVRHARLSLDRATLARAAQSGAGVAEESGSATSALDPLEVARRYRQTWVEQLALRVPERERHAPILAEVDREIAYRLGQAARSAGEVR